MTRLIAIRLAVLALWRVSGFTTITSNIIHNNKRFLPWRPSLKSWRDDALDSNAWESSTGDEEDWEVSLKKKQDGSYWLAANETTASTSDNVEDEDDDSEELLDIWASQAADEIAFNRREADRADKARQMEEWGFESKTIASALDVAVEEKAEVEMESMRSYLEESYLDIDDPFTVESHIKVPKDPETNEPIRSQMTYVDEHACIGCTNCAMIAQSTFFMEEENGRARVFEQWGDDDATIQIAIETCPVDCIHYVPFEELVQLEVQRRDQYINVLAGLVSRAERGAGSGLMSSTPRSFGSKQFTDAPKVSRTYDTEDARQELEVKERLRFFNDRKRRLEEERRRDGKVFDL